MSHLPSPVNRFPFVLVLCLIVTNETFLLPVSAHKAEIAEDVGGTLHIEPNDNPQAGKAALTRIALTRKGGQVIPLEQCNCQLAVYAEPHSEASPPLLKPPLKAVSAEGYEGIPGAEIVFPKAGIYKLELSGTPKAGATFKPFQLNYEVTVAAGSAAPAPAAKPEAQMPSQPSQPAGQWQTPAIALSTLLGLGIFWVRLQQLKGKRR